MVLRGAGASVRGQVPRRPRARHAHRRVARRGTRPCCWTSRRGPLVRLGRLRPRRVARAARAARHLGRLRAARPRALGAAAPRPGRVRGAFRALGPAGGSLRRGWLSVTTGTVNDVALLRRVAALGIDAVTTDDPATLRAKLAVAAY